MSIILHDSLFVGLSGYAFKVWIDELVALYCADIDLGEFPAVKAWYDKILARPAVQKGLNVPSKNKIVKMPGEE